MLSVPVGTEGFLFVARTPGRGTSDDDRRSRPSGRSSGGSRSRRCSAASSGSSASIAATRPACARWRSSAWGRRCSPTCRACTAAIDRIAAQIVTGIGFLGAGLIFREGYSVKGVTTAATIWTVAAVGIAVGAQAYIVAVVRVAFAVILLELRIVTKNIRPRNGSDDEDLHEHRGDPEDDGARATTEASAGRCRHDERNADEARDREQAERYDPRDIEREVAGALGGRRPLPDAGRRPAPEVVRADDVAVHVGRPARRPLVRDGAIGRARRASSGCTATTCCSRWASTRSGCRRRTRRSRTDAIRRSGRSRTSSACAAS